MSSLPKPPLTSVPLAAAAFTAPAAPAEPAADNPSASNKVAAGAGGTAITSLDDLRKRLSEVPVNRARRLGEALVDSGLVDAAAVAHALERQAGTQPHRPLGQLLVDSEVLSQAQLAATLADWLGVPTVDPRFITPEAQAMRKLPRSVALRETLLPLMVRGDTLVVAMPNPWDKPLLDELRFICELRIVPAIAVPGTLAPMVARAYALTPMAAHAAATAAATNEREDSLENTSFANRDVHELAAELLGEEDESTLAESTVVSESDNTLVRLINTLISDAIRHRASDIHIETADAPRPTRIRLRVDGELLSFLEVPARYRFALVARLKIMADADISEHRKPQDGKIDFARFGGPRIELRLVTIPTSRGLEDVVLRLLSGLKPRSLDSIGLNRPNLQAMRTLTRKSYGLVLVCGPTGCGKTTTLHSVMRELNTEKKKIWTAEDPVEINQEGLRQVQVNPRIGWTFAAAMRTFLRADPDVVMIGEMRDEETARIAVEASLTGHLVLSTLHTNSAPESITRLLEIGLDPFAFSDSLLGILGQRLVRRLCMHCRVPHVLTNDEETDLAEQYVNAGRGGGLIAENVLGRWKRELANARGELVTYRAKGCKACDELGYRGRMGLHELMVTDDKLRDLIRHRASSAEMQVAALGSGMTTLRQDGIEKALAGLTDMAEVLGASNG
jgi:type II secretory ATPase GspE/PulE/Tfp pilus assembly ATPase PilB-like protein